MGFYYAREKARFDRLWKKLRKEYKAAGMEEAAIQKLYDFDWRWFCSQRRYNSHNQPFPEVAIRDDIDGENSRLFQKFASLSGPKLSCGRTGMNGLNRFRCMLG